MLRRNHRLARSCPGAIPALVPSGRAGRTWDAPLRFRRAYHEQGDPPPPDGADVPDRMLPANFDPDELLGYTQSYAGQVTMLDTCLGAMFEFLDGLPAAEETLLTLISARGFPLGEHRRVGPCDDALFGELVHVPWMVRLPGTRSLPDGSGHHETPPHCNGGALGIAKNLSELTPAATRSPALVEPADLWATLLDWWGVDPMPHSPTAASVMPILRGQSAALHDRLCIVGNGPDRALRTPAWYLRAREETGRRRSGTPCLTSPLLGENAPTCQARSA